MIDHLANKFLPAMRKLSSITKIVNKSKPGDFTRFLMQLI